MNATYVNIRNTKIIDVHKVSILGCSIRESRQVLEKQWPQQVEHVQFPDRMAPGFWRRKRKVTASALNKRCNGKADNT